MADDSIISYGDLIGDDGTFEELSKQIKQIESELLDMAKTTKQAFQSLKPSDLGGMDKLEKKVKEIEQAEKNLVKTKKLANKARKKTIDLTNEELIQREKEKIQNRERLQIAKQTAILRSKEAGQIEKLRAKLSLTTLQWKKLSKEELNNTKKGKDLINTKRKLTDQLKKLEKQTGDTRRNVGNYTTSLGKLGKVAAAVFVGRSLVDGFRRIAGGLTSLIEKNKETSAAAKSVSESFEKFAAILEKVGLFIINAIAEPLKNLIAGFESFSKALFGVDFSAKKASDGVRDLQNEFNAEIEVLKRGNISTEARNQLIGDINKKYKDYLPNLLDENASLEDITKAQNAANTAFEKKILLLASEEQFIDLKKRTLDALREEVLLSRQLESAQATLARVSGTTNKAFQDAAKIAQKGVDITLDRIAANQLLIDQIAEEKAVLDSVIKAEGIDTNNFVSNQKVKTEAEKKAAAAASASRNKAKEEEKKRLEEEQKLLRDNLDARIKAIEEVQKKIAKLEGQGLKDKQDRLLALEQLRFKEEQKQREKDLKELNALSLSLGLDLVEDELLNQQLSEEQLKVHEQNKIDIKKDYQKQLLDELNKARDEETALTDAQLEEEDAAAAADFDAKLKRELGYLTEKEKQERTFDRRLADLKIQNIKDDKEREIAAQKEKFKRIREDIKANEKLRIEQKKKLLNEIDKLEQKALNEGTKKNTDKLLKAIGETTKKISAEINNIFQKQVDLSAKSVDEQEANLTRARDRAAKGLETNLAFEEQELAKRQSENLKRQKEAKQAAKFLTLLNLVSSYAANNDKNALARGLVDFSILTALEASFGGLYEGTEDTGTVANPLDAKGGRLYTLHDNERVVPKFLNDQLSGMTNKDMVYNALLGSQLGDYYNPQSPITQNHYKAQKEAFNRDIKTTKAGNSEVVNAIKNLENKITKQPNYTAQIVRVQEDTHAFILREVKQGMTKVYKKMLRAKK